MNIHAVTITILALLSATGCTAWPDYGNGGMTEHRLESLPPINAEYSNAQASADLALEQDIVARHLDVLVLEGAELCFPATIEQARQRQSRIARGLAGGLQVDASNDLLVQRNLLMRLERQLDYVRSHDICIPPLPAGQQTPAEFAGKIDQLLNADNQFAVNSSEINPKYLGHLAEAATLLREHSGYRLHVAGHADVTGNANHNQALSLARAQQVSRYLQIFGLPGERITVSALGSATPLFEGNGDEVRLTNRRVSVELIEAGAADHNLEVTPR